MIYAKIDEQGNVLEFPYRLEILRQQVIPPDAVEVDTETQKPSVTWDKKLMYDTVTLIDGSYVLSYTVSYRFSSLEEKKTALAALLKDKKQQNEKQFKASVAKIKSAYPDEEILSWDVQVREAEVYLAGGDVTGSLIETMATERQVTLDYLANRIVTKRNEFNQAYGVVLGKYQRNSDILDSIDLEDETTFDAIDSYRV